MTMGNMGFQQRTSVCDTAVSDHRSLGGAAGQGVLRIWKTRWLEGEKDLTRKGLVGQSKELELSPGGIENLCIHLFSYSLIQPIYQAPTLH